MSVVVDGVAYPSHAEYFEKYPWKQQENKRKNTNLYMEAISKPCTDCGFEWHPMVMTLDHVNRDGYRTSTGKRRPPAGMLGYPTPLFLEELAKCEPVCRNCHVFREFLRDGHQKHKKWQPYEGLVLQGALVKD